MVGRGGPQVIPRPEQWRPVEPAGHDIAERSLALDRIEERVRKYQASEIVRGPAVDRPRVAGRKSAVLVGLYESANGPCTILTRRPLHMRKHAGEVAFPGGAHDEDDETLWHTALREAHEEIDLDPSVPRYVGELDRFVTGASFSLVQPHVAVMDTVPPLTRSPDEVDEILHVPLAELIRPDVFRQEDWLWEGMWRRMHFYDLIGDTIWGATALMLHNLLEVAGAPETE